MKSLCILVIAGLVASALARTRPFELGPISSEGRYGDLPLKYKNLTNRDIRFALTARFFIEQFRHYMGTGFANVPPLDPLNAAELDPTEFQDKDLQGEINYSNFTLIGAQEFKLLHLETRLDNGRVDFEFNVPSLIFEVNYNSSVQVDVSHNHFEGYTSVALIDVNVKGAFAVEGKPQDAPPEKQKLQVVGLQYSLNSSRANYNLEDQKFVIPNVGNSNLDYEASDVVKAIAHGLAKVTGDSIAHSVVNATNEILSKEFPYTNSPLQALWLSYADKA